MKNILKRKIKGVLCFLPALGTSNQLMELKGVYAHLFEIQARNYR
jgi:hypothetical protein